MAFEGLDKRPLDCLPQLQKEVTDQRCKNDTELNSKEKPKNVVCFFCFGILSLIYDEICLIAAEDILAGSTIATTTVILSIAIPVLIIKLLAPWCLQRVSYLKKLVFVVLLFTGGLTTLVSAQLISGRLAGVSIVECGVSISEITLLSLTAFYKQIALSAFVAGVGVSSFLGPLYYTSLTTWTCASPRTTLSLTLPWPLLMILLYVLLDKDFVKKEKPAHRSNEPCFTFRNKLATAKNISPFILFLFITYFSEYLSNHAVLTTLGFPNAPFPPRDHYPYYILSYHIGKFMGRSHLFLVSAINPKLVPYIHVRRTWILALIVLFHAIFFFLASWLRFVPHVEIIMVLCCTEGFTAGSMYLNSAHAVSGLIVESEMREFALSLLTVGNASGKLLAGLFGLIQEPFLRRHCYEELGLGQYCLTRHVHKSGWSKNSNC